MKHSILLSAVLFLLASCTKKYDFECVTYPNWIDTVKSGIDPNTGKALNMVSYWIKKEVHTDWRIKDAEAWINKEEMSDPTINAQCTYDKILVD